MNLGVLDGFIPRLGLLVRKWALRSRRKIPSLAQDIQPIISSPVPVVKKRRKKRSNLLDTMSPEEMDAYLNAD
jgi:hypothetical protein